LTRSRAPRIGRTTVLSLHPSDGLWQRRHRASRGAGECSALHVRSGLRSIVGSGSALDDRDERASLGIVQRRRDGAGDSEGARSADGFQANERRGDGVTA
jgi:hypothetical protein